MNDLAVRLRGVTMAGRPDKEARVIGATIGGALGGLVGALIAGPVGATIGAAVSSAVGHRIAEDANRRDY